MNPRARHARSVLRDRRRGTVQAYRLRLPNGSVALVRRYAHQNNRASYQVGRAHIYGAWPPDSKIINECCRWS